MQSESQTVFVLDLSNTWMSLIIDVLVPYIQNLNLVIIVPADALGSRIFAGTEMTKYLNKAFQTHMATNDFDIFQMIAHTICVTELG